MSEVHREQSTVYSSLPTAGGWLLAGGSCLGAEAGGLRRFLARKGETRFAAFLAKRKETNREYPLRTSGWFIAASTSRKQRDARRAHPQ